jgi:heat shock protein HtpX
MARTRYASDAGLVARMGATMFTLGLVIAAFAAGLVYLLMFFASARRGGEGASLNVGGFVFFAAVIGIGSALASYYWSDKIALATSGAKLVGPNDSEEARRLHAIVDRICMLADMPKPRVAIAPTRMPNAFATGRNTKVAVVCATRGILDGRLDNDELEGVLAHEISHVAHKDVAVMTIASVVGVIAALMVRFAFYSELFGGGRRGGNGNNQSAALLIPLVMVMSILFYAVSFLLIRMLSRYRELSADRSGALLTAQPGALASALVKVSGDMGRIPQKDLREAAHLNAFYFSPALRPGQGLSLLSTHPPLKRRLAQLEKIAEQLGQPAIRP